MDESIKHLMEDIMCLTYKEATDKLYSLQAEGFIDKFQFGEDVDCNLYLNITKDGKTYDIEVFI